jgi:nucleotide-binding universal stress UspA family protein
MRPLEGKSDMIARILVPLDGSAFAEWALPTAISLARRVQVEIRLVRVLEGPHSFDFARDPEPVRARAEAYLVEIAERLRARGCGEISVGVREGSAAAELESEAAEWGADLVLMSTHGRTGLSRLWMGSVAARCVEVGFCPVLLVRPPEAGTVDLSQVPWVGRVVVPLDGSETAERALAHAEWLARAFGVHAVLLRVLPDDFALDLNPAGGKSLALTEERERERSDARRYVERQVARLRRAGVHAYGMLLTEPRPPESISDRMEGDVVVMATNGHGRLDRKLFGSVTDRVVRAATYPVLVVPPDRKAMGARRRSASA